MPPNFSVPALQIPPPPLPSSSSKQTVSVGFLPRSPSPSPPPSHSPAVEFLLHLDADSDNPARVGHTIGVRSHLSQLCRAGRTDLARRIFDGLPRPVPTVLWNALLIGYACNARSDDALQLYHLMNTSSSQACSDHYTYSSVLKACADSRRLRHGQSIHCCILRRFPVRPTNRVLNNSLLNMYASAVDPRRASAVDVVRLLFDGMPKKNVVSWNTLIGWYVRSRRPALALDQFGRMIKTGIRPSPVSFVNVFPAAALICSMNEANCWPYLLYGMLIKFGRECAANLFVVSSAISMFSEHLDIQSARRIFDCASEKNIEVWNTMIGGYVRNAWHEEALALFIQVLESDEVKADNVTFVTSMMAISQLQDDTLGQQVHAYLIKDNSKPFPLILDNALMVMYSRCDDIKSALKVFCLMIERDIVSWNTMVSAFVQKDLNFEGLMLVDEMHEAGLMADSVTVTALLSAASNLGSLHVGKETHGYLIRQEIEFEGMLSYLIDMYAKSGCVETATKIFDRDECTNRDEVTWNAMISGYMHNEHPDKAISLFRKMLERNHLPNHVTISLILPACDPIEGIRAGKQIHGYAIRQYLDANVFVSTALIDMYSKCGGLIYADKIFNFMPEKTRVTFTTMLSGYGQHGLGERALSLFNTMQSSGINPDAVTFVALISACSYSGLIDEGLAVFESMKEHGVEATPEHYCCVVDLLGRAGRVEEAYDFVRDLGDSGSHVGIWGSLLAACKLHNKYELGKLVSRRLFDMEYQNGNDIAGYHVLMSNVYAAEGRWDGVHRVRKGMKGKGLMKEPGSSWIEIREASHRFVSRDKYHPESDCIHAMLDILALDMRSSENKHNSSINSCEASDLAL